MTLLFGDPHGRPPVQWSQLAALQTRGGLGRVSRLRTGCDDAGSWGRRTPQRCGTVPTRVAPLTRRLDGRLHLRSDMWLDGFIEDRDGGFGWAEPDAEVHAFANELERGIGHAPLLAGACTRRWPCGRAIDDEPDLPAEATEYAEVCAGAASEQGRLLEHARGGRVDAAHPARSGRSTPTEASAA